MMSCQHNVIKENKDKTVPFPDLFTCLWDAYSNDYLKRDKRKTAMFNVALQLKLEEEGFGSLPLMNTYG